MAISKEKKIEVVQKVKDIVSGAKSVVFATFKGLGANETNAMRSSLRDEGVGYYVAKKTLTEKALGETKTKGDVPALDGELAIVFGDDETGAAREFYEFQKKYPENLSILGGIFEGEYMDKSAMTEIAQIPSMHTLRAQFVNLINSPIQRFAVVLGQIAEKRGNN